MPSARIFLGDLTYDTVSLSTDSNPLNVGYIAAYCKKMFGADVDISLFKYIDELENALYSSPPDILALSNYCWCERIGLEMFKLAKHINPSVFCVWGGPNLPSDDPSQREYLFSKQELDVYIPLEGEIPFSNFVQRFLDCQGSKSGRDEIFKRTIDGCIVKDPSGNLLYGNEVKRLKNLDEIPSPYIGGFLDKFFDGKLKPSIEVSRGCPFACSFCVDGAAAVNKVNRFSLERIKAELVYIAEHVPQETEALGLRDRNFGMNFRDLDICDAIAEIQELYGYPRKIMTTTGKNSKEKVIKAIKKLRGSLLLSMSVQTLDPTVQENIRRKNLSASQMLEIAPTIQKAGLRTVAEVIFGLPGETFDSQIETYRKLVNLGMEDIQSYTLMLLHGSELATPQERNKWGFLTKYRVLPRDFVELRTGKKVVEIEEVVVGSDSLSFEEYLALRKLALVILTVTHGVVFDSILKYLRHYQIDLFELPYRMLQQLPSRGRLTDVFQEYEKDTINELWNSPEEIEDYYQDDEKYSDLVAGREGFNVIQVHHASIIKDHMSELIQLIGSVSRELLKESGNFDQNIDREVSELQNYCNGISHKILSINRMNESLKMNFEYDVLKWLNDIDDHPLTTYKCNLPLALSFEMEARNIETITNELNVYGNTNIGRAQAIKRIEITNIWRTPKYSLPKSHNTSTAISDL